MEADWIVGCDGAHSAVRKAIGVEFRGEQLPVQAGLADGLCEGLDRERIHLIPAKDRLLAWFPLPAPSDRPLWRAIVLVPASASPLPAKASAAPFAHPKMPPFGEIEWYSGFRISSRQAPFVRQGNVLLCGDAAHIHSPAGGQGMNLGIQDAWSLAAALSRGGSAVDEWATTRHAVASQVIRATDMATRMMISSSPIVAAARRLAVGVLARAPVLRGKFSAILAGMNYPPLPE